MKIVTGGWAALALVIGLTGSAYAQSGNPGGNGLNGAQPGAANSAGAGFGTGLSTSTNPGAGLTPDVAGTGMKNSGSGPALSNMRANGTSLDMNPDPHAPNVTGRPAPPR